MKKKLIAEYLRKATLDNGTIEITFAVKPYGYNQTLSSLENKEYSLELGEIKSKRTIRQNRYLWALIHEIAEHEDGYLKNEMETYCALLEMADAKHEYIRVLDEAVETLRTSLGVRGLHVVRRVEDHGKVFADCKLYLGSSKFDTKEFARLLDVTIQYAEDLGIETEYYRQMIYEN